MFSNFKFDHAAKDADFQAITKFADEDYVPTYKLQLVAGRNLQPSGWTREFLVNESFVKSLGFKNPADILNKEVSILGGLIKCPIVGVLKDFNNRSLRQDLSPLLIATNSTMYRQASIKLSTTNIASSMQAIKIICEKTLPNQVYDYRFLDDKIESFYKQESQLAQLYKIFAAIAIFLSCLGLYGLASFMAVQRTKEVGIRKVLGASEGSIVYLFSREFIVLVIIAFLVASAVAWYFMHNWLQNYPYRISLSWWMFILAGAGTMLITLMTVSFQAIKAAVVNPIKSLKAD
jgi:ABC-type antimicrobial peptide transport system permease subunit